MTTKEKIAVEEHLLVASGFKNTTRGYKLIQRLFKSGELDFMWVNRDDAIELRKGLWFLGFECGMRWNKIIITDDAVVKYYEKVMGLKAEPTEPEKSYYEIRKGL